MSNTTLLPFAQVPGEILMDDRLKPTHIRVLIALYMHKNKKREEVWPKRKTLAVLTGIHKATISRLTTELERFGWVTKQGNSGGCGKPAAYLEPAGCDWEARSHWKTHAKILTDFVVKP